MSFSNEKRTGNNKIICYACGEICDCLLIYTPPGQFGFQLTKDDDKMREAFRTMPLRNPMRSMLLGVLVLLMSSGGYFAFYLWMRQFDVTASVIMLIASVLYPFCAAVADAIENSYTRDGSGGKMHMHRESGMMHCYASAPVFKEGRRDFDKQIILFRHM